MGGVAYGEGCGDFSRCVEKVTDLERVIDCCFPGFVTLYNQSFTRYI